MWHRSHPEVGWAVGAEVREPDRMFHDDNRSGRLADTVLAVVLLLVLSAAIIANVEDRSRHPDLLAYGFAAGIAALMLLRRRWPSQVLVGTVALVGAYYASNYPAIGLAIPLAGALFSVAESGRARRAALVAAVLVVASSIARLVEGDDPVSLFGIELAVDIALLAAVIALGDAFHSRRQWHEEARRREELARAEQRQEAARRIGAERVHIARELHDVLGHTVSLISIQAGVAVESVRDDPAAAEAALHTIRQTSRAALDELRQTLEVLRDPGLAAPLDPVAGVAQLDRVVATAAGGGLVVGVHVLGDQVPLPVVVDTAAHRIVQESITNVLRHAHASTATVELRYARDELVVRISDDGCAVPGAIPGTNSIAGYGIRGMRERVGILGGTLTADSGAGPEGGFLVEARLPLRHCP